MWVMLEDSANFTGVTPFLQGLIEAPDMRNITQSYQYLYESDLITDPNDRYLHLLFCAVNLLLMDPLCARVFY